MQKKTPLHARHVDQGAKMTAFCGWDMPLHYGSQIKEHLAVRGSAGLFDISHMTTIDVQGTDSVGYLQHLLVSDVGRLHTPGGALYTCLLNNDAGIIDDLIVYFLEPQRYRLVTNAATRESVIPWLQGHVPRFDITLVQREELGSLAIQGPDAQSQLLALLDPNTAKAVESLASFTAYSREEMFIARTGYSGEDGYEIICPTDRLVELWDAAITSGVLPVGLGARDSLRLEAGLNLYGNEMDEAVTPLECGLNWLIDWRPVDRSFIGRDALQRQMQQGPRFKKAGLVLDGKGIMRRGIPVEIQNKVEDEGNDAGIVTSGGFSPTLNRSIALARLPIDCPEQAWITLRSKRLPVRVVSPPFVKHGTCCITV